MTPLQKLHGRIAACMDCPLGRPESETFHRVPGEGPEDARVMIVGEAPGAEEERTGRPFVGRSGNLLTEILTAAGLKREEIFITSVCKCRPPQNRTPKRAEMAACLPWLTAQIELIRPEVVLTVGNVGTQLSALWAIETAARNGIAAHHIILGYLVNEVGIGYGYIRSPLDGVPLHVLAELLFHRDVADHVTPGIIVEQAVKANTFDAGNETARRRKGLQAATGAYSDHRQRTVLVAFLTGGIVDVGQRVKFVDDNVDVVAADAVALAGDSLTFVGSSNGVKLAATDLALT